MLWRRSMCSIPLTLKYGYASGWFGTIIKYSLGKIWSRCCKLPYPSYTPFLSIGPLSWTVSCISSLNLFTLQWYSFGSISWNFFEQPHYERNYSRDHLYCLGIQFSSFYSFLKTIVVLLKKAWLLVCLAAI